MKTNTIRTTLAVLIITVFTNCSHQLMSYNSLVPQTTDARTAYEAKGDKVSAKGGTIDKATEKALIIAGKDYNALINGTITMYHYDYLLFDHIVFKVEGTPVKLKESSNK